MNSELINQAIGWDIVNWGQSLKFLNKNIELDRINNALEIGVGSDSGGISIYLASKNINVLCTDYKDVNNSVIDIHRNYPFANLIEYGDMDILNINPMYKNKFDLVVFKSVLGGLDGNNHIRIAEKAIENLYECLNENGYLFFSENLAATRFHMYIRNNFGWGRNNRGWNYYKIEELISAINNKFEDFIYETKGFIGCFGRNETQKTILGNIDKYFLDYLLKNENKYIFYCICKK